MTAPIAIIMGSQSDWETMRHAAETLVALGIDCEKRIVSAHRTPDRLFAFAKGAKAQGFKVIIAGAGGAAHLPGMAAALTELPVFGVPIESKALSGIDSLYSIVQMPAGVPVGTLAIGKAGAINAGRHLHDRVQRIDPRQRLGFDGNPEHRKFRQRRRHARQMRRTSGAGDDDLEAGGLGAAGESEQPVRGPVGRDDALFALDSERSQRFGGMAHGLPVGLASHNDGDRCGHLVNSVRESKSMGRL